MSIILFLIDFIVHVDKHIDMLIDMFGALTYIILFLIVFCETGLVVTPFLPGDSLLFAIGAFAARGSLHLSACYILMLIAAIGGDSLNYYIGEKIGQTIYQKEKVRFIKKENIDTTVKFFERHGGKTIFIARFMPIVRTFAPFVAGMGSMEYKRFITYNAVGGFTWVTIFMGMGYFFGNLEIVQKNFSFIIVAIVGISFIPIIATKLINLFMRRRKNS